MCGGGGGGQLTIIVRRKSPGMIARGGVTVETRVHDKLSWKYVCIIICGTRARRLFARRSPSQARKNNTRYVLWEMFTKVYDHYYYYYFLTVSRGPTSGVFVCAGTSTTANSYIIRIILTQQRGRWIIHNKYSNTHNMYTRKAPIERYSTI